MSLALLRMLLAGMALHAGAASWAPPQAISLQASDGLAITAWLHHNGRLQPTTSLLVLVPGFAQREGTASMNAVAGELSQERDCLLVDLRGNGASSGRYTFGAEEWRDVDAARSWAEARYARIDVLGFSLGAYTALRSVAQWPGHTHALALACPPPSLERIVLSGGALLQPLCSPFQSASYAFPPGNDLLFRWGSLFGGHPSACGLAAKAHLPTAVLVGGRDCLIFPSLSQEVYASLAGPKSFTRMPQGLHAERMFLQDPAAFEAWLHQQALDLP
jgi:pimeloyl-ACP methyl ester carboxylesterase